MIEAVQWLITAVAGFLILGTLLNLSDHPHWFVRGWDFPRGQIALLLVVCGAGYAFFWRGQWYDTAFVAALATCVCWHLYKIRPYTIFHSRRVAWAKGPRRESSIRLLICNVLMENRRYQDFVDLVLEEQPDVVLVVEVDERWTTELDALAERYPHSVRQPQSNCYGMMVLSRLELVSPKVEFLVQDDIPSIHTQVELPSGDRVCLHALHPRPPEPIRDQDSGPRDAELVIVGREIGKQDEPTIVAGDLNDVAWSPTSELFLRLSGLLDARMGRGFFNSWNADHWWMRFPLDHVFHSNCFKLIELRRLRHVGSDHFPLLIDLSYEPEAEAEQPETQEQNGDQQEAQEKIEREQEDPQSKL